MYKPSSLQKCVVQLGLAPTLTPGPAVVGAQSPDIDASASSTTAASADVAGYDASLDLAADNSTSGAISQDGGSAESETTVDGSARTEC